jgi:DUF971 family protein
MTSLKPWPTDIVFKKQDRILSITYDTGEVKNLSARILRVESPSAEVQGHHPSQKLNVVGKELVTITDIKSVGNYAIRLIFDDGHQTGIYTWDYLYHLEDK